MIIISDKPGQLGNLLIIYATVLAYSIENNCLIYNPSFYNYQNYFIKTKKWFKFSNKFAFLFVYYLTRALIKLKINNKLIGAKALDWNQTSDLSHQSDFNPKNSKLFFIQGWLYRSDSLIEKHSRHIKNYFAPKPFLKKKIDTFFEETFGGKNEVVIGVHIRQGDYETFENGKYFYTLSQYKEILRKLENLFDDKKIRFLICSNTKNIKELFTETNYSLSFAPNHELLDMYCLARCNYIVGPPSTYSIWASFYGNVPLYMIHDPNKSILLNDFKTRTTL